MVTGPNIGQVVISGINVDPTEVTSGGTIRVTVRVTETAEFVGPGGQLRLCNPDGWNPTGLEATISLEPSWGFPTKNTVCVPVSQIGAGELELDYTLTAPQIPEDAEQRQFQIGAYLESTKNDERAGPALGTVIVSRGSAAEPGPSQPDDGNGGGGTDYLGWIMDNPVPAAALGVLGYTVVTKATESATEQIL